MTALDPFGVVVADPPWQYRNYTDSAHGAAASAYDTMDLAALSVIPVPSWAAPDSVLALWGTWPKLDEAVALLRAWGFAYVTGIPWVKTSPASRSIYCGVGFWTQSASEILLFGTRGNPKTRDVSPVRGFLIGDDRQFYAPRNRKHSRKPLDVHTWLEAKFPGPYLELFATKRHPGWTCWGRSLGFELTPGGVSEQSRPAKSPRLEEYGSLAPSSSDAPALRRMGGDARRTG